ncbi:hypothetical protein GGQ22_19315 [Nocardioides sp. zg-579]|uniref:DUF6318 domain-containing protein n=1 Tax=Nocardioides marmotae TaxID=2663857 RepID=A0A6I3JGT2_9ACTN|nr:DUF6318 family protein [Nocardioides marmotae]MCR6033564.1 hypothetical protein [Gordonia jinghuaiqii]MTB97222.1 hypothetical protein [Nocardioides marmotae]QKE02137.1 hypothetical protein HPC71_14435 [Nocardioides marmotae]
MSLRTLGALTLTIALALSACTGDDPEPTFAPEPSASATTSPAAASPTPVAQSPEDAVRAWVEARNRALQNGDTSGVESLSSPSCSTCEDLVEPIEAVYGSGGRFQTPGWEIAGLEVQSETDTHANLTVGLTYAAGSTIPSEGASPVEYGAENHMATFRLRHGGGRWLVDFIGYLS